MAQMKHKAPMMRMSSFRDGREPLVLPIPKIAAYLSVVFSMQQKT